MTRREFVSTAAGAAMAGLALPATATTVRVGRASRLRVGVIGCGGRGTGAAHNMLEATPDAEIVSLGDVMPERLAACRARLAGLEGSAGERARVPEDRCFAGWDAWEKVLASGIDVAILATPPHFRPAHFAAAVAAGCHVFLEKPVAVDPAGVRVVLDAARAAKDRGLSVVAGTQRRHESSYLAAMAKVREGALGRLVAARCCWLQGGLWMHPRRPEWSDMEWQLRNWLYFTWLSGDHIVEQHVHNLDVVNWALAATPRRCVAMGGREVRTDPAYGNVFDHFAVEFEYPGGVTVQSTCRQIDGCVSRVDETFVGTQGTLVTSPGQARLTGPDGGTIWKFEGENNNPYVQEHVDLVASIASGDARNEGEEVAHSTLTAIMGRMAAYTGKAVTWEQALNSKLDLTPAAYAFGPMPTPEVAVPGKTRLV